MRADDLQADPLHALQRLAPGDERGEEQVAERAVLVQELAQRGALDRDVPQRLDHERVDEDRLPRQEVQLAEEARGAVPDELVPGRVDDRDLAFEDRDERIASRSPTRYSSSPAGAERSSPISARAASCDGESSGLAGVDTFVPP